VAVDLRGHGESPDGPWEWDAVLEDLEATTVQFGLTRPVVVGHSLGGILAGMWAVRQPDCPGVVSLDGHRAAVTDPANYVAYEGLEADLAELDAVFAAQQQAITRPSREITSAWRASKEFADALPVFARVTVPFLLVLAAKNLPVPFVQLLDAHRAGLRRDLPIVCPNVRVHEIDATHGMVSEQPAEVATLVNAFITP
jgi:pimeloyl-ACP methyl ester carboxylesterase